MQSLDYREHFGPVIKSDNFINACMNGDKDMFDEFHHALDR